MIRIIIILLFICIASVSFGQNCYPNGLTLVTQAEIDAFSMDFPACSNIQGDLIIQGDDIHAITDLSGLSQIVFIGGDLKVSQNHSLTSLQGLHNITSVAGNIEIANNNILSDCTGLSSISSIGGNLKMQNLPQITNLDGFQQLNTIGGDLNLQSLSQLDSLGGLENLHTIEGILEIFSCSNLPNLIGLVSLTSLEGLDVNSCGSLIDFEGIGLVTKLDLVLSTTNNPLLKNFNGLDNLTSIGGDLTIRSNGDMLNLNGLNDLSSVGGTVNIKSNPKLITLNALKNVTTIGENYYIEANQELTEIAGFLSSSQLATVGERFWIETNPSLSSLDGFNSITSVGISFKIFNNNSLTTLSGFNSLASVPSITINHNDKLVQVGGFGGIGVAGVINVSQNEKLTSLVGFASLDTAVFISVGANDVINTIRFSSLSDIKDGLTISHNPLLTALDINALERIGGNVLLSSNDALESLPSVSQLEEIKGNFTVQSNPQLSTLSGLSSLARVDGDIVLSGLPALQAPGMSSLEVIGKELNISQCGIHNMTGLESLLSVGGLHKEEPKGGGLNIVNNDFLVDFDGLSNIDSINGSFRIEANDILESLGGLDNALINISPGINLKIRNNPMLATCSTVPLCEFMHDFPTSLSKSSIFNNAPGCDNTLEMIEACGTHPDYPTLVNIFFFMGGFDWISSTGWIQDCDPCGITSGTPWEGVQCNQNNRVIALDLSDNNLSGALYHLINGLTHLESLNFSNNGITDTLPLDLFELDSLQVLNLSNNEMTYELPPELANLLQLQELYIDNNDFRGCFHSDLISLCATLISSNVNTGNDFYSEWDVFCDTGKGSCCHFDVLALEKIYQDMGGVSWTNDDGWLSDCDPCGVISGTSWSGISCENNRVSQIALPSNNLQNQIPPDLSQLAFLKSLNVNGNAITGEMPIALYNMVQLEFINLSNNSISGEIPLDIQKLRNLEALEVQNNQFSGTLTRGFGILNTLGGLNHLNVENNQFSGCFDEVLSGLCNATTYLIDCNGSCNNFNSTWSDYCADGTGSCDPCGEITWIGSTGFSTGDWNASVNWDRMLVPENCHSVHIPTGHSIKLFSHNQACLGSFEIMAGSLFEAAQFSQMNVQDSTCQPPEEFIINSPINQKK